MVQLALPGDFLFLYDVSASSMLHDVMILALVLC